MEWIKGIKQLRCSKDILDGIGSDILKGNIDDPKEIPRRIELVQSAFEDAKKHFIKEDI